MFFRVSFAGDHGVRLCSVWGFCGCGMHMRHALPYFLLSFAGHMRYIEHVSSRVRVCRSGSVITSAWAGGCRMDFYTILDQVIALLRQRHRVTYRALQRQFGFDDTYLEDLKAELIDAQR